MSYSLMLSSQVPPEETIGVARLAERTGFSRIWLTEDYYRKAAFASCAAERSAQPLIHRGLGRGLIISADSGRPLFAMDGNAPPNVRRAV